MIAQDIAGGGGSWRCRLSRDNRGSPRLVVERGRWLVVLGLDAGQVAAVGLVGAVAATIFILFETALRFSTGPGRYRS